MSLWGRRDLPSGNQKPLFANTSNATSRSTIHGNANNVANSVTYYGNVLGLSAAEEANTRGEGPKAVHAGWVSQKIGTGGIVGVRIVSAGQGYNANGFLVISDTSVHGQGATANISFGVANTVNINGGVAVGNALQNGIVRVSIVNPGRGFSNVSFITANAIGSNITGAVFAVTLGGRAGRTNYETLVAMGSISEDDPRDNAFFTGV
jgi:hypothetical protein